MPKSPTFSYRKTSKGWLVNVPASVSDTGSKRRRYFKTRDEAKEACQRLRDAFHARREKSQDIRPFLAQDAIVAAEILGRFGVTLTQSAKFYEKHHDVRAKAPVLNVAWERAIERRSNHRARTLADFRSWKKALPDWFMSMNVHDITASAIKQALDETTKGQTRWKVGLRYLRTVMNDCVKSEEIGANPTKTIHIERSKDDAGEVSIYSPQELKELFAACKTYPEGSADRLCAPCAVPFAFMAFAGIRPDEVTKLRWDDVSVELENIRIGPTIAKKARRRNVRIQKTLAEWIATVPTEKREGKIVPPRWRYKAARVRKEAGIDGHEKQDALRHSFGTYLLAVENNLDALKADMGHEHVRVFFDHYHKAITKREALPYWEVLPV
jgi:integrase